MPSMSPNRRQPSGVDLLPWADPYIAQLFAEAERIELAARATRPEEVADDALGSAPDPAYEWDFRPPACGAATRRRRTESARSLARC